MSGVPLRSEIETALDELVAYEEGMRFQGLAVVLARRHWPELVASERKKDLGLDAFVTRDNATDGVGRGLACSITPTYQKIADDATKVSAKMPGQIQQLIFATSGKVGTATKLDWGMQLKKDFGYDLVVMSREDILSSLTDPENVGLCRTYLGLHVAVDMPVARVAQRIRVAAQEVLEGWAGRVRGQPLIDLFASTIDAGGVDRDDVWSNTDIAAALADARRVVLEGPAGCGKTTTLLQLARGPLCDKGVVFLVDLPLWAQSGKDILAFLTGMAAFQRTAVTPQQLAQCETTERFYFLLNGWNEVSDSFSETAVLNLRDLERQFPAAGMLVATRAHYVAPPLPGGMRLRLRPVGPRARSAYVRERLGANADALLSAIKADPDLDDLTRTPFVLHEVTSIVSAGGGIPRSRVEVIEAAVKLQEQSPEHDAPLRLAPLLGMSSPFLEALAAQMILQGSVSLKEASAREVIHRTSEVLAAGGQLPVGAVSVGILNTLSAHHVLERFDYPEPGYRFAHQLFQEYYGFRALERRFEEVRVLGAEGNARANFIRDFVNEPGWTQPLEMLAESTGRHSDPADRSRVSANALADMCLSVDPVFSAHLAAVAEIHSNDPAGHRIVSRLRDWYESPDEHHRQCALAGMLASGMDSFRDIIEPLFSSDNDQVRLSALRLWPGVRSSVVGANWQVVVREWSADARATFVWEILHHRFDPQLTAFALADPSPRVKEAAIEALSWIGAEDDYVRALQTVDETTFSRVIVGTSAAAIPSALRERALPLLRRALEGTTDAAARLQLLIRLRELGDSEAVPNMKVALADIPDNEFRELHQHTLKSALDALRDADPAWTNDWVTRRIADGQLWSESWIALVTVVPGDVLEEQFARLATQDLEHRYHAPIAILGKAADANLAQRAFLRLLEVWQVLLANPREFRKLESAILWQLEALLRAIPADTVVSGLSKLLSGSANPEFIEAFAHLYGRTSAEDAPLLDLDDPARSSVRKYLKSGVSLILHRDDYGGEVKAYLASVFSQVGEPEDITDIMLLVRADLKRVTEGREARRRAEETPAALGASTSWAHWYVRAIVRLLQDNADDGLLGLFDEVDYERSLLEEYARQFAGPERRELGHRRAYDRIWRSRAESSGLPLGSRRARVAEAIRARIHQLEGTRGSAVDDKHVNYRLKMLALGLAAVAPRPFAEEIIAMLSLPADFDAHIIVETLQRLLFAGVSLPADKCLPLMDHSLARMKQWGIQDHERWTIVEFLCVCPFVDDPEAGLDKIREVIPQARLHIYDFRGLLPALAHSRSEGALSLLLELVPRQQEWQAIHVEWMDALTDLDTDNGRNALLGLVDPELPGLPFAVDWHSTEPVAARIAEIAAQDPSVEARLHALTRATLDDERRAMLAKVLSVRATTSDMLAALNLLDDSARPPIPFGVQRGLEHAFVEERAHASYANAFTRRAASSNQLRAKLFSMSISDHVGKRSAYSLLGQIEEWRLEYGRPIDEPRHPDIKSGSPWPPPAPT